MMDKPFINPEFLVGLTSTHSSDQTNSLMTAAMSAALNSERKYDLVIAPSSLLSPDIPTTKFVPLEQGQTLVGTLKNLETLLFKRRQIPWLIGRLAQFNLNVLTTDYLQKRTRRIFYDALSYFYITWISNGIRYLTAESLVNPNLGLSFPHPEDIARERNINASFFTLFGYPYGEVIAEALNNRN